MSAQCFLLDVGQGSANLIHLAKGRVIIVDSGPPRQRVLIDLLCRLGVTSIDALILTHNDADHTGGSNGLIETFHGIIKKVWFLDDRDIRANATYQLLCAKCPPAFMRENVHNLQLTADKPARIYTARSAATECYVYVLHPTYSDVLRNKHNPNAACAILLFKHADTRVVFAGDAPIKAWRDILLYREDASLNVDVLAVPHHAGITWSDSRESPAMQLDWLFQTALRTKVAIVSVSTMNSHNHPREEVIAALRRAGAHVMCTQITHKCCQRSQLFDVRRLLLAPIHPSASHSTANATRGRANGSVGCATTVAVDISADGAIVDRLTEHAAAVDQLSRNAIAQPLCRRS
jgi:competence protein ComEC